MFRVSVGGGRGGVGRVGGAGDVADVAGVHGRRGRREVRQVGQAGRGRRRRGHRRRRRVAVARGGVIPGEGTGLQPCFVHQQQLFDAYFEIFRFC